VKIKIFDSRNCVLTNQPIFTKPWAYVRNGWWGLNFQLWQLIGTVRHRFEMGKIPLKSTSSKVTFILQIKTASLENKFSILAKNDPHFPNLPMWPHWESGSSEYFTSPYRLECNGDQYNEQSRYMLNRYYWKILIGTQMVHWSGEFKVFSLLPFTIL